MTRYKKKYDLDSMNFSENGDIVAIDVKAFSTILEYRM